MMCFRKPVGEDEVIEKNEALAKRRDFTADDLEALPEDVRAEVIDDKTLVEPDLIVICDKDKLYEDACYGAPDLVIEVASKSTRKDEIAFHLFPELVVCVNDLIL